MIEQQGRVVAAEAGVASVRVGARSGCSACDAGKGCGAGVFGRLLRRKPVTLEVENTLDAGIGQAVIVGIPEQMFLSLVFRFYLLPLLAGLTGAAIAYYLSTRLGWSGGRSDLLTLAGALAAAVAAAWRLHRNPMEFPGRFIVHLLRNANIQNPDIEQEE